MGQLYDRLIAATDRDTQLEADFSAAIGTVVRPYMALPVLLNQLPANWRFMWFQDWADPAKRPPGTEQNVAKVYGPQGQVYRVDAKYLGGALCAAVLRAKGLENL